MKIYEEIIKDILSGKLEYNSEDWGRAVNVLLEIESIDNDYSIELLSLLSNSQEYISIISMAFVLKNISASFILKNKIKLKEMIKKCMSRKCIRANVDFIPVFCLLLENKSDYFFYNSFIESLDESESSVAISNLLLLDDSMISRFHKVSDFNFNLFLENLDPDYEESYLLKNNEKPIYYKKLLITSYYKWNKNKNYIYSLTERNYVYLISKQTVLVFYWS